MTDVGLGYINPEFQPYRDSVPLHIRHHSWPLLGNPRWEKRLLKFLQRTKIGRIGPDLIDDEIRRVTRYEGWTDLVPDERSIDRGEQVADHILDTIVVRQT
jgi:hypothetical protein